MNVSRVKHGTNIYEQRNPKMWTKINPTANNYKFFSFWKKKQKQKLVGKKFKKRAD